MPTSDMRHPGFESFRERDRRIAAEEIEEFLLAQAARRPTMAGKRILQTIAVTCSLSKDTRGALRSLR